MRAAAVQRAHVDDTAADARDDAAIRGAYAVNEASQYARHERFQSRLLESPSVYVTTGWCGGASSRCDRGARTRELATRVSTAAVETTAGARMETS